jgi:hypothetical protein
VCTLTVIPLASDAVQLAFNRDESRTRAVGLPPRKKQFGNRAAILPTDPASGGTWLAVNDAGLALAVLNVNLAREEPTPPAPLPEGKGEKDLRNSRASGESEEATRAVTPFPSGKGAGGGGSFRRSRGEVIPALLECDSPSAALAACEKLDYRAFAPFRLVLVGDGVVADVRWDGREPMVMSRLVGSAPQMFTSSGLGDHLVEGVRRELFNEMFASDPETWEAAQRAFHRHKWPGREHLSVNMSRATARTVSHAVIDICAVEAIFTYHADAPDKPAEITTVRIPLLPGAT